MMQWLRKRSLPTRVLVYVAAATLAFALAAGLGAVGALMLRGDLNVPSREAPRAPDEQKNAARPQEKGTEQKEANEQKEAAREGEATPQQDEATYVSRVGDIQDDSVETFLENHNKLVLYDALTADDVMQMQANVATLEGLADQADALDPPQNYEKHYEEFGSANNELHEAGQLAYNLAADPTAATQTSFDEYDRHANEATALLQRSNELLGQDYKTINGVQAVNPLP